MSVAAESQREASALMAAADAAETDADELEAAALDRGEDIDLADVEGHRKRAGALRFRAAAAARKAEREAAAARLDALAQLRADVEAFASGWDAGPLCGQLAVIAAAAAQTKVLAGEHDTAVAGLVERAAELGCTAPAPGGPRIEDGGVALGPDGSVTASDVRLMRFGERVDDLPARVAAGHAAEPPAVVERRSAAKRPAFLLYSTRSGGLFGLDKLGPGQKDQIAKDEAVLLGADEIDAFMAGRLEITPAVIDAARARQAPLAS